MQHLKTTIGATSLSRLRIRLIETTDVHANLLPFDYYTNRKVTGYGLTCTATLIRQARASCRNSLLLDNGDYLQGTPISDLAARRKDASFDTHPAILAMNALGYDAATLGNHEFNFGLDWLTSTLRKAEFPITCANLVRSGANADEDPLFAPYLLLDRVMLDETGQDHNLRIGIIGLAPPQTTTWDQFHLGGKVKSLDIIETARHLVPQMRAAGADLVIALAHSGITPGAPTPMMENAALQLGDLPGIDAILAGHSHEVFPNNRLVARDGIVSCQGTLHGTPAVMAGARGAFLGLLDLELSRDADHGWQVTGFRSQAQPLTPDTREDRALRRLLQPVHEATVAMVNTTLGHTRKPLHSYLALLRPGDALLLVTRAKRKAVERLIQGTAHDGLPVLAAGVMFKTGGRAGPEFYTDIAAGPLCLRHAADLYSFPNLLCVLRLTGAELRDWLERAAIAFNRITPGLGGQFLCNAGVPAHQFDVIDGLTYEIDLTRPARYDLWGRLLDARATRIRNLRFGGKPLDPDQPFLLATNNYRAFGGGPYPAARADQLVLTTTHLLRDIVADYIADGDLNHPADAGATRTWRFTSLQGTEVLYDTGPGLRAYPDHIEKIRARDLGDTPAGFMRLAVPL